MLETTPYFFYEAGSLTKVFLTQAEVEFVRDHVYSREELIDRFTGITNGLDLLWLMVVSIFMFYKQVGFAFMATGAAQ